jgi:hypothetical protein
MKIFGNFKYVLILSFIILIMMIIKVCENNAWPGNAGKAAEITAHRNNFITKENLRKVPGQITLIKTGLPVSDSLLSSFPGVNVSWEEMMQKQFLRKINEPDHTYVIVSGSHTDGVRAWVLLDQMGVKDLFILDLDGVNNELFKYQFQPDTTISPELVSAEE